MSAVVKTEHLSYISQGLLPSPNCQINTLHDRRVCLQQEGSWGVFTPEPWSVTGDPPGTRRDAGISENAREPLHSLARETSKGNTRNL
ncbi:hypothetical protein PAL_GLEAN10008375 [Pteropus alecto]|uniref:Uncharacterized protein n=1 Tax=Pteropus alecto TaxID=9402 RepID=L5KAV6_PTEAL|nr:hypothetical protein PAL_GLEAN10008375 [Pteropus alecto]